MMKTKYTATNIHFSRSFLLLKQKYSQQLLTIETERNHSRNHARYNMMKIERNRSQNHTE